MQQLGACRLWRDERGAGLQFFLFNAHTTAPARAPTSRIVDASSRQPKLNRTHARARASSRPIAVKMRGGVGAPDEHAEPCDAYTPSRSSEGTRLRPSTSAKHTIAVF